MGYGDDLLVTSLAAKIKKQFPERQIVVGIAEKNQAFHSPIYENNPNIADAFVSKLDVNGTVEWTTYLGSDFEDSCSS